MRLSPQIHAEFNSAHRVPSVVEPVTGLDSVSVFKKTLRAYLFYLLSLSLSLSHSQCYALVLTCVTSCNFMLLQALWHLCHVEQGMCG